MKIGKLRAKRRSDRIEIAPSEVGFGPPEKFGTLKGHVTLERLPKVDLTLSLPHVHTKELFADRPSINNLFHAVLALDLQLSGSINTRGGVETSGTAKLSEATFVKVPALEAIDQLMETSILRIFSAEEGELTFTAGGGKLNVTSFECRSASKDIVLKGNFIYTAPKPQKRIESFAPDVERSEFDIETAAPIERGSIEGMVKLGVRPRAIEGNELATEYFTERAGGRVWIEIPLSGFLSEATKELRKEILSKLRR